MALGNWNYTAGDWPDHRALNETCALLADLTENEQALILQEACAQKGEVSNVSLSPKSTWLDLSRWGMTLLGDEPYDNKRVVIGWRISGGGDTFAQRIYCVERAEYYPNISGQALVSVPGPPAPIQEYTINISLLPPAGPWSAGSYEFVHQVYQGNAWLGSWLQKGLIAFLERVI